jgi:serine/threonine-protein kinase
VNPDLPRDVDRVLSRALAKDPDARYATASEFVEELGRALEAPRTASTRMIASPPRRTRTSDSRPVAAGAPRRDSRAGVLLAALGSLILVGVIAFLLFSGGGGGGSDTPTKAKSTPTATAKASSTPEKTATPEATQTAAATPSATATPAPAAGGQDLGKASQLQVAGFNARKSGDYAKDLQLSQQALDACGSANQLNPCGYALFEKGLALNRLGRPDEAIPVLQERLDRYGDNPQKEVSNELKAAKKAAKG